MDRDWFVTSFGGKLAALKEAQHLLNTPRL
jgi:hypothetical protein